MAPAWDLCAGRCSELIAERQNEELEQAAYPAAPPLLERHLVGVVQVVGEDALELARDLRIVEGEVELVVQREGAAIEVRASHARPLGVDGDGLGVEKRAAVLVDPDPGPQGAAERGLA